MKYFRADLTFVFENEQYFDSILVLTPYIWKIRFIKTDTAEKT